jgi:hypothetical protein
MDSNYNQSVSHRVTKTLSHIEHHVVSLIYNGMPIITDSKAVTHNGLTFF